MSTSDMVSVSISRNNDKLCKSEGQCQDQEIDDDDDDEVAYFTVRWKTRASFVYRTKNMR